MSSQSAILLMITTGLLAVGPSTPRTAEPQTFTVIGLDYAFQVPAGIHAGPTTIFFDNRGKFRHMMVVAHIKSGVSADSAAQAAVRGVPIDSITDGQEGTVLSRPAQPLGMGLAIDLVAGADYLVYCNLRDTPGQPLHRVLGMVATFRPH